MRIVLSGGGTGGHIYPAVTIARELKKQVPSCELLFIGTKQGLEADIVPKEGFELKTIEIQGIKRSVSFQNMKTVFLLGKSLLQCRTILKQFKPDIVVGTGGYVCGPVVFMASMLGIPTVIQEQNAIPGVTNKIAARFVDKVMLGYEEAKSCFPQKNIVEVTGNPIRPEVIQADKQEGITKLGLSNNKLTIFAVGGSRGARTINQAMLQVHQHFCNHPDVQVVHVTGQQEYEQYITKIEQMGINISSDGNIIIKPYLYDLPLALATADIAIYRAGAIGLAELTARGVPAILVPYPYAAENHQEYNAKALEKQGAAKVITDRELTGGKLVDVIESLINSRGQLDAMAEASRKLGRPHAAADIVRHMLTTLEQRQK